ncbi:MAG TPA: cytochrome c oxidase assembly protein [Dehalococcoidia bacterium]|nr:cytochrome c oxidase assembly protein [Dehalococcoidia bacterium]
MLFLHTASDNWYSWDPHPDVLLLVALLAAGYIYAIHYLRPKISDAGRVKRSQITCFFLGVLVIYVASSSPMHELSEEYLLSVHMFQHLLFTMVAAPLFLAGIPGWLWQALLSKRWAMLIGQRLTNPLVAFALFNLLLLLTHLPPAVELALQMEAFHFLVHAALVAAALLMWWPILSPVPELPRLPYPGQMAYLFLQSLLPAVLASFVTFSDRVVYEPYAEAPRLWGLSAIEDQQIAGGIMKTLGTAILWTFIAVAFFKWYEKEEAMSRPPRWREVEEELQEIGLNWEK